MGVEAQPTGVWQRLRGPFQEFGWAAGSLYVVDRLLHSISPQMRLYTYDFMVQPISNQALLPPNLSRNLSFQEIGPDHADLALMPARPGILAQRFAQGARCVAAYKKDQLIGYMWFCSGQYDEDEVRCTYQLVDLERSVFDFDFYVLPQYRLGLGFLGVWQSAYQLLSAQGVRYTFSRLTRFNLASRRAHARLGWKRVGRGIFLKLWRVELMLSGLSPFVGLTLTERQRVALRLRPDVLTAKAN